MKLISTLSACILGFLGVALGAFGAHGLEPVLEANGTTETYHTATLYHLIHAILLFMLGLEAGNKQSKWLNVSIWTSVAGVVIFSGSLYLLSITGMKWMGAITPFGGVCFLTAWASAGMHVYHNYKKS